MSSYLQFEAKKITEDFDLDSFPSEKPTMQYGYSKLLVNLNCRGELILVEYFHYLRLKAAYPCQGLPSLTFDVETSHRLEILMKSS